MGGRNSDMGGPGQLAYTPLIHDSQKTMRHGVTGYTPLICIYMVYTPYIWCPCLSCSPSSPWLGWLVVAANPEPGTRIDPIPRLPRCPISGGVWFALVLGSVRRSEPGTQAKCGNLLALTSMRPCAFYIAKGTARATPNPLCMGGLMPPLLLLPRPLVRPLAFRAWRCTWRACPAVS